MLGLTFLRIADGAEDVGTSTLAQLCAWVFFIASIAGLTIGPLGVLGLASILRKSTRR
jgi:hypothetical protein